MIMLTTHYLAEELVRKVLSCLPVKYVLRCKLVCKLWLSIILDPDFIQAHLTNSLKRPSVLTPASVYNLNGSSYRTVSIISNSFEDSVNIPLPSCLDTDYCSIISKSLEYSVNLSIPSPYSAPDHSSTSSNGLVCLNNFCGIYLWNPSTRQGKKLRASKIKVKEPYLVCTGFYFDSISNNDYKILQVVFLHPRPLAGESGLIVRVELYSTKSDSWSEIQVDYEAKDTEPLIYDRNKVTTSGFVIKRVLYMNGSNGPISFRLDNRKLKPVPLPSNYSINCKLQTKKWEPKVFDFEGCAALILNGNNDESLSLWTLDDDDHGFGSWRKKFNLEADIMQNWTTIYFGVGQLVAWEDYKRIILYDYKTKETKKLGLELPYSYYIDSFFRYTESLVSLKGFREL